MKKIFNTADILLPDFNSVSGTGWACVACDQYTSEPHYWENADRFVGELPSTLRLILPEVYLSKTDERLSDINKNMQKYLDSVLISHPDSLIYLERTQSDGKVRRGIVGAIDLEEYDYAKGSQTPVRATEGTVLERIPPRVKVRRDAPIELPHVMLLIDDDKKTVIEKIAQRVDSLDPAYEFELMQNGGSVRAFWLSDSEKELVFSALDALASPSEMERRYGSATVAPLLFAVGDGNHSLATARACYELTRERLGDEAAKHHPSRYALCEIVNLHDQALEFEPIYRVVFNTDPCDLMREMKKYADSLSGGEAAQTVDVILCDGEDRFTFEHPAAQLTVGTLQAFLDSYKGTHPEIEIDYIHGKESTRSLVNNSRSIGFIFDGMTKDQLFKTVIFDGALPRKTFSMGHADDKRFYIEARKIK